MDIIVRDGEACAPDADLAWDTVWVQRLDASGGYGEWILAGPADQRDSRGGLRAEAGLHTATLICLFTDAPLPEEMRTGTLDADPRGWWGDSIKLPGEPSIVTGSLLWTLERGVATDDTRRKAERYARQALAILADQGAVARTDVRAEVEPLSGLVSIEIVHWSHAGAKVYQQRFERLWQQQVRPAPMNYGDTRF